MATGSETVGIWRELARVQPDAFRRELAAALNNHLHILRDLGRREEAETAGREAVKVYRELADGL